MYSKNVPFFNGTEKWVDFFCSNIKMSTFSRGTKMSFLDGLTAMLCVAQAPNVYFQHQHAIRITKTYFPKLDERKEVSSRLARAKQFISMPYILLPLSIRSDYFITSLSKFIFI
jgi:hypothetical protein